MSHCRAEALLLSLAELPDKVEALINNYELARRTVLGFYGWKGVNDTHFIWHFDHPDHIEDEVLTYAAILADENGAFWNTEMYHHICVLDRLNCYEICPEEVKQKLHDRESKKESPNFHDEVVGTKNPPVKKSNKR